MSKRTNWLNRDLIVGPYLTLVLSEKECHKAFRLCRLPKDQWAPWIKTDTADATMHRLDNPSGNLVCIVAMRVRPGISGVQAASMLVHEAVHVWQCFRQRIGEESPSAEFEAYAIQAISQRLMSAYAERYMP